MPKIKSGYQSWMLDLPIENKVIKLLRMDLIRDYLLRVIRVMNLSWEKYGLMMQCIQILQIQQQSHGGKIISLKCIKISTLMVFGKI